VDNVFCQSNESAVVVVAAAFALCLRQSLTVIVASSSDSSHTLRARSAHLQNVRTLLPTSWASKRRLSHACLRECPDEERLLLSRGKSL
jgi:hypothetical protein